MYLRNAKSTASLSVCRYRFVFLNHRLRRVWRYQRGNKNPYIEEEHNGQKKKVQKDKQRSTKHTYRTKARVTWCQNTIVFNKYPFFHKFSEYFKKYISVFLVENSHHLYLFFYIYYGKYGSVIVADTKTIKRQTVDNITTHNNCYSFIIFGSWHYTKLFWDISMLQLSDEEYIN